MDRFNCLTTTNGTLHYLNKSANRVQADLSLLIIKEAWNKGLCLESECDGYGEGQGTMDDWSGIRDSTDEAKDKMLEKALNFLFKE